MKWKLGNPAGIGVYIHWTFWLLPAWILLSASGGLGGAVATVLFVFAVFGCVVLHELGHALMARHFHIGTRDITLYPIGGVASLERIPKQPSQELAIALAGPAVNVIIAAVLFTLLFLLGIGTQGLVFGFSGGSFLVNLMLVNVALVAFNMLPAFPMDGGRVLRALLALRLPYLRATEIAVRVGQAVAIFIGLAGLFTTGTMLIVALFVFVAAQAELSQARNAALAGSMTVDAVPSWFHDARNSALRSFTVRPGRTVRPSGTVTQPESGIVWLDPDDSHQNGYVHIVRARP